MSTSNTHHKQALIDRLFKAGAHFGFKKSRRHPTVAPYLFTTKQGNDIFDLEKSVEQIENAKNVVRTAASLGKTVLFVGTKEEVTSIVKTVAVKINAPYVVNRWIGGMLTNFTEIKKRIMRMDQLARERESGELDRKYTKKERVILGRETAKLAVHFGGIATISKIPDVMVVVDPRHDLIAVEEARQMKVPIVAIMSSDCNVGKITHPVLVNDALQSSISIVLEELAAAYVEGQTDAANTAAALKARV